MTTFINGLIGLGLIILSFGIPIELKAKNDPLAKALELIENDDFPKAITLLDEYIARYDNDPQAYYYRGISYKNLKKDEQAILDFEQTIDLNNNHLEAHYALGMLFYHHHQYAKAADELSFVLRRKDEYPTNTIYYEYQNYDDGVTAVRTLNSIEIPLLNHLGLSYAKMGQYEKSLSCFEKAIKKSPDTYSFRINHGVVHLHLTDTSKAIKEFEEALRLSPDQPVARYNLWLAKKEYSDEPLLYMPENNPYLHAENALRHFEQKRYTVAILHYDSAISIDPSNDLYFTNRGLSRMKQKEYIKAASDFGRALKMNSGKQENLKYAGDAFFMIEKYDQAITLYDRYLNNSTLEIRELLGVFYNKGLASYYKGDKKGACKALNIAVSNDYAPAVKAYNSLCK